MASSSAGVLADHRVSSSWDRVSVTAATTLSGRIPTATHSSAAGAPGLVGVAAVGHGSHDSLEHRHFPLLVWTIFEHVSGVSQSEFGTARHTVHGMSNEEPGEDRDTGDAQVALWTGIRDQRMVVSGWFASHADSGTRGPHVHLSTNDRATPVLRTSQIPDLVDALHVVGERIDRLWETDGADYPFGDAPDDNDPAVIRQRRIDQLVLLQNLREHFSEIAEILLRSQDMHDASAAIAPLLGLDELEVTHRLNNINLFAMTRTPSEAGARKLADLRRRQ